MELLSDEEGEIVKDCVTDYQFVDSGGEPISFSAIPLQLNDNEVEKNDGIKGDIYLRGKVDGGLRTIYKKNLPIFLSEMSGKRKVSYEENREGKKLKFINNEDDGNGVDDDGNDESNDTLFDRVCAFCDDGGDILWKAQIYLFSCLEIHDFVE